jgi:hypothetical protein
MDLAWVAGLLEGEGCFYLTTRHNKDGTPRPLLSVICTMTDEDVIRKLHATIGTGGVTTRTPENPKWSQSWTWADSDADRVVPLLRRLQPFMGTRRSSKISEMLAAAEGWERRFVHDHGTAPMYARGCKCAVCRASNARRQKDYLSRRRVHGGPLRQDPAPSSAS